MGEDKGFSEESHCFSLFTLEGAGAEWGPSAQAAPRVALTPHSVQEVGTVPAALRNQQVLHSLTQYVVVKYLFLTAAAMVLVLLVGPVYYGGARDPSLHKQ